MASFNLIDEPWIPCAPSRGGPSKEFGLRAAFTQSHDIGEIVHESPLVTAAIHRLLLAILHRNFGPGSLDEWCDIWNEGQWDLVKLDAYLDEWRNRFDLFDPERPFYQVSVMADVKLSPVTRLGQENASGNNATLFDHNVDGLPLGRSPSEAACSLVATQAYAIGFGVSRPFSLSDSVLTRGLSVFGVGSNLFETMMLNMVRYDDSTPIPHEGNDLPCWEMEDSRVPDRNGTQPLGYLDYLTWQSRRINLRPEGDPLVVKWCQVQQNLKFESGFLDPFKCYRRVERRGFTPLSLSSGRAVWRDNEALLQDATTDRGPTKRPEVFNWLARIDRRRTSGSISVAPIPLFHVFGFATDVGKAASVSFWRQEKLPLPLVYLNDEDLVAALRSGLRRAEDRARELNKTLWILAAKFLAPDDDRKPDPKAVRNLVDHLGAERGYWSRLEGPFKRFMVGLPNDTRLDEDGEVEYGHSMLPDWEKTLEDAANRAFTEATNGLDRSARSLKAVAIAERFLRRGRRSVLGEIE